MSDAPDELTYEMRRQLLQDAATRARALLTALNRDDATLRDNSHYSATVERSGSVPFINLTRFMDASRNLVDAARATLENLEDTLRVASKTGDERPSPGASSEETLVSDFDDA